MTGLRVEELRTVLKTGTAVVRDVSFTVEPGEIVGLVGESGSGKTLTALSVAGLLPAAAEVTGGKVFLGNENLLELSERRRRAARGAGIAMIYQDPMTALNPLMTVGAQISEGLRAHGVSRTQARERTLEAIAEVRLPQPAVMARRYPHQLSGGQRQRMMIAGALAMRPAVLIADEPTTALDVTVQQQILALVDDLRRTHSLGVLWITHDLAVLAQLADRVLVMYAGRIVESASTVDLFESPRHPYTAALLASIPPATGIERPPLPQIGGVPPDLAALPAGCPFQPRCEHAEDRCSVVDPPLDSVAAAHEAACLVLPERWS
ncbi:ABC transporter ATP-binding protein [Fodinicola feengrottensis]|uniref:ABC transporter ATP-binding protein n=1 Tax=Fodinicola feengrottensis TaxID=435914 RepID=A0ABP4UW30_9ACTN|nr:ABC transporter ATP-binding protein [Fodinicola feengrottensis]